MSRFQVLVLTVLCSCFAIAQPLQAQAKKKGVAQQATAKTGKIDINKASEAELMANLQGVGEKRAKAIVAARKKGRFQSTDDLLKVPGIGPAIILNNFAKIGLPRGKVELKAKKAAKARTRTGGAKKPSDAKPAKGSTKKPAAKKPATKKPAEKPAKSPAKKPTRKKAPTKKSTAKGASK